MAKDNTKLDVSLCEGLALAKKRPVHYVMAIKGSEVVGLILQKKKIKKKQAVKAKKEGKATLLVEGVCTASGMNLVFEVIETPPDIKNSKIKDFVAERTDVSIKPDWVVVPQFTAVPVEPGDEDPDDEQEEDDAEEDNELQETGSNETPSLETRIEALSAEMSALAPDIKQALVNHPSAKGEFVQAIQLFKSQIAGASTEGGVAEAQQTLARIRDRLAALPNGESANGSAPTPTGEGVAIAGDLMAQMNLMTPQIKAAIVSHPQRKDEFVPLIQLFKSQHASVLAGGASEGAVQTLANLRSLLSALSSDSSTDSNERESSVASEQEELESEESLHLQADEEYLSTRVDVDSPFYSIWPDAKRAWRDAMEEVDAQIAKLQQKLLDSDDDDLMEIGEFGLNAITGNHKVPIMAGILEVDQAGQQLTYGTVMKLVQRVVQFRTFLSTDIRIAACDENPLQTPVAIRSTLIPASEQLEQSLAEALP